MSATISATMRETSSHVVQCLQGRVHCSDSGNVEQAWKQGAKLFSASQVMFLRHYVWRWSAQVAQDLGAGVGLWQLGKRVPVLALHMHAAIALGIAESVCLSCYFAYIAVPDVNGNLHIDWAAGSECTACSSQDLQRSGQS